MVHPCSYINAFNGVLMFVSRMAAYDTVTVTFLQGNCLKTKWYFRLSQWYIQTLLYEIPAFFQVFFLLRAFTFTFQPDTAFWIAYYNVRIQMVSVRLAFTIIWFHQNKDNFTFGDKRTLVSCFLQGFYLASNQGILIIVAFSQALAWSLHHGC